MTPCYPAYQDSRVEWLGEVPEGWDLKRLRFAIILNPSKSEIVGMDKTAEVSFIPMEAVGENGELDTSRTRPIEDVETGYTYLRNGDMTFAKITPCFENGKRALMRDLIGDIGFGTTELTVLRPRHDQTTSQYLFWLLSSPSFRKTGEAFMYGAGGQKRVPDEFVRNFIIALPSLPEQSAIAAFLDRETAKIDTLVSEQRRLIDLLKEKRKAIISHAVTRGLNPNAPLKPSGIDWLGDVPERWEVVQLRHIIRFIESGTSVNATDVPASNEEYGILKTSAVYTGDFDPSENKSVVAEEYGRVACPLRLGALIVSRMNTPDLVGAAGYVSSAPANLFLPDRLWQIIFDEVDAQFVHLWTRTSFYRDQVRVVCAGTSSSMQNLSQDNFKSFLIAVPPPSEQAEIVQRVSKENERFDTLINTATTAIALLQERRAALISAAVTGKIDVRDLVPQAKQEYVEEVM